MLDDSAFDFLPESIPTTIILTSIPLISLVVLWSLKDKLNLPKWTENISHEDYLKRTTVSFMGIFIVIMLVLWKGVPGTDIPVDFEATPYHVLNLANMSLAIVPIFLISKKMDGFYGGWLLPMLWICNNR